MLASTLGSAKQHCLQPTILWRPHLKPYCLRREHWYKELISDRSHPLSWLLAPSPAPKGQQLQDIFPGTLCILSAFQVFICHLLSLLPGPVLLMKNATMDRLQTSWLTSISQTRCLSVFCRHYSPWSVRLQLIPIPSDPRLLGISDSKFPSADGLGHSTHSAVDC